VSRSIALAHITRREDGTSEGAWGPYVLKSAFQPIYAFKKGQLSVAAFEGLLRPFRDELPCRPHDFFLSVPASDRFHVETLSRNLHLLNAGACLPPAASIFVNFDPSLFGDRGLVDAALRDMRLVLHEARIEPARVVCEVSEQKSVSHRMLADCVSALRRHGFAIAVDHYGAANSDIERVNALAPDMVKFDMRSIAQLMDHKPGRALLRVMVEAFDARGIVTVFEGVEERWQLEVAEEAGAAMVQGFALARPELASANFHHDPVSGNASGVSERKQDAEGKGRLGVRADANRHRPIFGRRTGA
jgi:EAL domain-containing protein (putative c-di-GMP-specific phosphodiesterase class I)